MLCLTVRAEAVENDRKPALTDTRVRHPAGFLSTRSVAHGVVAIAPKSVNSPPDGAQCRLDGLKSEQSSSDELQSMFDKAVAHAEQCEKASEDLRDCDEYLGRPDYTGTGIAILKKAQAELAIGLYAEAAQHAQEAGSRLAAYPNNRWWRMACHDTAARTFARLHNRTSAEREYRMAFDIWEDSSREDLLRNFELTCTRALIDMETGDLNGSLKCFSQIAGYTSDSVPPKAVYLFYYLEAAARAHDRSLITELLGKMSKLKVKW